MNKKNIPQISVIMSIYSEPIEWIKDAIDSILSQSFRDFEFIIINDNPTRKENLTILNKYIKNDNRIIIIKNKKNIGLTKSLNEGIKLAKGRYIARMDADDVSLPSRFEKQYNFMENHHNCIVCGTQINFIGDLTKKTSLDWIKNESNDIKSQLALSTCFIHPTVLIRKNILTENEIFYDEFFEQSQDYKLWADLYTLGEFNNLNEVLLLYRKSSHQISTKKKHNQQKYSGTIRRRFIESFFKTYHNELLVMPEVINLEFIKKLHLKYKDNSADLDNTIFFKKIILTCYLSISKANLKDLLFYFYSLDFYLLSSNLNDFLRVLEKFIFPQRKANRL